MGCIYLCQEGCRPPNIYKIGRTDFLDLRRLRPYLHPCKVFRIYQCHNDHEIETILKQAFQKSFRVVEGSSERFRGHVNEMEQLCDRVMQQQLGTEALPIRIFEGIDQENDTDNSITVKQEVAMNTPNKKRKRNDHSNSSSITMSSIISNSNSNSSSNSSSNSTSNSSSNSSSNSNSNDSNNNDPFMQDRLLWFRSAQRNPRLNGITVNSVILDENGYVDDSTLWLAVAGYNPHLTNISIWKEVGKANAGKEYSLNELGTADMRQVWEMI